jgi:hypothetical protein
VSSAELPEPSKAPCTTEERTFLHWARRGFADAIGGGHVPEQAFASLAYGRNLGYLEGFAEGLIALGEAYQAHARREAVFLGGVAASYHASVYLGQEHDESEPEPEPEPFAPPSLPSVEYPPDILAEKPARGRKRR